MLEPETSDMSRSKVVELLEELINRNFDTSDTFEGMLGFGGGYIQALDIAADTIALRNWKWEPHWQINIEHVRGLLELAEGNAVGHPGIAEIEKMLQSWAWLRVAMGGSNPRIAEHFAKVHEKYEKRLAKYPPIDGEDNWMKLQAYSLRVLAHYCSEINEFTTETQDLLQTCMTVLDEAAGAYNDGKGLVGSPVNLLSRMNAETGMDPKALIDRMMDEAADVTIMAVVISTRLRMEMEIALQEKAKANLNN
jgi:hypothetical protein